MPSLFTPVDADTFYTGPLTWSDPNHFPLRVSSELTTRGQQRALSVIAQSRSLSYRKLKTRPSLQDAYMLGLFTGRKRLEQAPCVC